jgi:hypothetical protein
VSKVLRRDAARLRVTDRRAWGAPGLLLLLALAGCSSAPSVDPPEGWTLTDHADLFHGGKGDPMTLEWAEQFLKSSTNTSADALEAGELWTYAHADASARMVRVYDLTFSSTQDAAAWRPAGVGGLALFTGVCGLQPWYPLVDGKHGYLVVGTEAGRQMPSNLVYLGALDLHDAWAEATGGEPVCRSNELLSARQSHPDLLALGDKNEPNNDRAHATPGTREQMLQLTLPKGDVDWYSFSFASGGNATFVGGAKDVPLAFHLTDADGKDLGSATGRAKGTIGQVTSVCLPLPAGTYTVEVKSATGAPVEDYWLVAAVDGPWGSYCA